MTAWGLPPQPPSVSAAEAASAYRLRWLWHLRIKDAAIDEGHFGLARIHEEAMGILVRARRAELGMVRA